MAATGEDEPDIEVVDREVREGESDDVVDNEIALAKGIADRFAIDLGPVHGRNHGEGERHDDSDEDRGANHSAGAVLGKLHENRCIA